MRNFKGFVKKSVSLILSIGVILSLQTFTYAAVHKPATDTVYTEYLPSDSNFTSQESMSTGMKMDKNEMEEITDKIVEAGTSGRKEVDISQYNLDEDKVLPIYSNFLSKTPYLFTVNHSYYSYYKDNRNKVTKIKIPYNSYTDEQVNKMKTELDSAVDKAIKQTSTAKTDLEKAAALYDYLVLNTTYNYKALTMSSVFESAYSPYGALVQKNAVCAGIASAYKLLLNKVGIPCDVVTSIAQNHEWDAVKIGNNYYNADPTFDISKGYAYHDYFLKSDNYFFNHMHNGWKIDGISYNINSSPYDNWYKMECDTTFVNMNVGDKYTFYLKTGKEKPSFLYNNEGLKVETKSKDLYKITALQPGNYYLTIISDGNWWTDMLVNVK